MPGFLIALGTIALAFAIVTLELPLRLALPFRHFGGVKKKTRVVSFLAHDDDQLGVVLRVTDTSPCTPEGFSELMVFVRQHWLELPIGHTIAVIQDHAWKSPVRRAPTQEQCTDHGVEFKNSLLALSEPLLLSAESAGQLGSHVGEVAGKMLVSACDDASNTHSCSIVCHISTNEHRALPEDRMQSIYLDAVRPSSTISSLRQLRHDLEHDVVEFPHGRSKAGLALLGATIQTLRGETAQVSLCGHLQDTPEVG
mmetsp:Transcript_56005/g.149400  ORF Transcript_56005/g.149400 Transcript_56005/m.149400 type:complete len:254 (-) Transcript_56005:1773-2534(-)